MAGLAEQQWNRSVLTYVEALAQCGHRQTEGSVGTYTKHRDGPGHTLQAARPASRPQASAPASPPSTRKSLAEEVEEYLAERSSSVLPTVDGPQTMFSTSDHFEHLVRTTGSQMRHEAPTTGKETVDELLSLLAAAIQHGHKASAFLRGWQAYMDGKPLPSAQTECDGYMTAFCECAQVALDLVEQEEAA